MQTCTLSWILPHLTSLYVVIDVNECLEGTDICLQECINTPGSYQCSCLPGFLGFGDSCEGELLVISVLSIKDQ